MSSLLALDRGGLDPRMHQLEKTIPLKPPSDDGALEPKSWNEGEF